MTRNTSRIGTAALAGVVVASVAVAFAAGAGSPLFVVYQREWGFPNWQLTTAFTVYAIALLLTLLIAGSVSDFIGRRPVLIGALVMMMISSGLFLVADGIGWIIVARVVQGIATGAATSNFTAAIIELSSERRKSVMTVVTSAAPVGGLALGAFGAGVAIQLTSDPTLVLFSCLAILFALGIVSVLLVRETAERRPGVWRTLKPQLQIPNTAKARFISLAPLVAAGWMFSGLFLGLTPSLDRYVFDITNAALNGAIVALQPISAAIAGLIFVRFNAVRSTRLGALLVTVAAIMAVGGISLHNIPILAAGAIIGGAGQGAGFGSTLRILGPLAHNSQRGALLAAVLLIAYAAYGVPVLIGGIVSGLVGLETTAVSYAILVALVGSLSMVSLGRRETATHELDNVREPPTPISG
ncbi:MFS transporter [Leifsonia sp. RAF41]|uniref:MFS transporter n=1 Tax=Leifsonia sp. RAF41 TaxID=3233056 RepID=UPI003F95BC00